MRNGNILMHSKINLLHRRRCITFVVPFLVEIHMPILYSTEKDEGGVPHPCRECRPPNRIEAAHSLIRISREAPLRALHEI